MSRSTQACSMVALHRHQIAWLGEAGWRRVLGHDWDAQARDCLGHWAAGRLPLVVTRQTGGDGEDTIALGLPAPGRWGRRRLSLAVARSEVLYFDEFPLAAQLTGLLPAAARPTWRELARRLKEAGAPARVYGSHGWQLLTGLNHVRTGSDIDLWLAVSDAAQADAVAACLQSAPAELPRLDGELMFADGAAVAWREWRSWRAGRVKSLLVKRIGGSAVVQAPGWQGAVPMAEAA